MFTTLCVCVCVWSNASHSQEKTYNNKTHTHTHTYTIPNHLKVILQFYHSLLLSRETNLTLNK